MGRSNFMLQFMLDTSLSDAEEVSLKMADLVVTSVNLLKHPTISYGAQTQGTYLRICPQWVYPGLLLLSDANTRGMDRLPRNHLLRGSSGGSDETAAAYISQKNGLLYYTKCVPIGMGIPTAPC